MIYQLLKFFAGPLISQYWLGQIEGLAWLPRHGPLIIAANHSSYLDFFLLAAASPRRIRFIAAEKFFSSPLWQPLVWLTGQIKVDRRNPDKEKTYAQALAVLKKGGVIGIFPEGTRSPNGRLGRFYPGAVRLALLAGAPIIPAGLTGAYELWPRQKFLPRPGQVRIEFGQPYCPQTDYPNYQRPHEDEFKLEELTLRLRRRIARLSGQEDPEEKPDPSAPARDGSGRAAAFFDVDNTLVDGLTLQMLLSHSRKRGLISWTEYWRNLGGFLLYKLGWLKNPSHLRSSALQQLLKGKETEPLEQVFKECFQAKIKSKIFSQAGRLIGRHLGLKQPVWLVSASLDQLVEPLARHLGVTGWRASEPEVADGRFTGRLKNRSPWSEEKSRVLRELAAAHNLDLDASYFYSDHVSDLPALEAVGHPVAVNPDRRLRKVCQTRKWPIFKLK